MGVSMPGPVRSPRAKRVASEESASSLVLPPKMVCTTPGMSTPVETGFLSTSRERPRMLRFALPTTLACAANAAKTKNKTEAASAFPLPTGDEKYVVSTRAPDRLFFRTRKEKWIGRLVEGSGEGNACLCQLTSGCARRKKESGECAPFLGHDGCLRDLPD